MTPEEEVTAMFCACDKRNFEALQRCDEVVVLLGEATSEAFANPKIRKAIWYILITHPLAWALRPPILMLHRWVEDEIAKKHKA